MPAINSRVRAFDHLWRELQRLGLSTLGSQRHATPAQQRVVDSVQRMHEARMPIAAILEMAEFASAVQAVCDETVSDKGGSDGNAI
jgi:hypothetical protein